MKKAIVTFALLMAIPILWLPSCSSDAYKTKANDAELIHRGIRRITDIMRHDIFSPPVASRIYAYASVAGYEALIPDHPEYQSLAGQLNGLTTCPQPEAGKEYCFPLASIHALMKVGKHLIFSESSMDDLQGTIEQEFEAMNMPQAVYDRSVAFGDAIADHIIQWSKSDHYAETRSAPKYTIDLKDPSRWVPTPPQYADALEPHWMDIRPWVMDSARQFKPIPHVPFSLDKNSDFYAAVMDVYNVSKSIGEKEKAAALYWDCNPFEVQVSGHLMLSTKKISPGGHWMNICAEACRIAKVPMMESMEHYTMVSLSLADAFISCWTCKFDGNLVRPETYINRYIDPEFHPFIETPPFPEHTSGHATVSAAAATILTNRLGEPFAFTDSTEMEFNLPAQSFKSFYEASDQAAMSRLWGGIHYRIGNEGGRLNGREIGKYVLETVKTKR
ncbi:MAG: vanadium-dependent haloperoxidase [Lewinellaceae bacterium]|nr:vanadium-dependent haloperoxidase [Lewinellaceae bacterium]